ncbi:MAG: hypothetical protein HZB46_15645 [Solirubrobacterales bacterium]|nr:hypothetical protein [Solirubrobacterales bacterium]
MTLRLPAAVVAAVLLALPAAASATTTATRAGNAITITGDDGVNVISVNNVGDFIMYEDKSGPGIVAGAGCYQENPSLINCGKGGFGLKATITLGGGDDTYDDRLPRTDWPVVDLDAGDGNDTVNGSYGNDVLRGGAGNDTLRGIGGDDQIDGGPGDDTIHGGADNDTVVGGPGRDSISGDGDYSGSSFGGNDTIQARDDEIDQVACGFGADSAVLDAADVVDQVTDCEAVDRPAAGGGGGSTPTPTPAPSPPAATPAPAALAVTLARPKRTGLRALAAGRPVAVTATISQPCAATLKLTVSAAEARRAKLGRTKLTLASAVKAAPAGTLRASLKVKKAYRSKLRRLKRLKTTLSIACAGASGTTTAQTMSITLTR